MSDVNKPMKSANSYTAMGFLAMCFAVVGLVGLFALFAAPLPLQRAIAREQALDETLIALHSAAPQAGLDALKDRLDDSAAAFSPLPSNADVAVAQERVAMRARLVAESNAVASRMQLMIGVVTIMASVFGAALIGFGKN